MGVTGITSVVLPNITPADNATNAPNSVNFDQSGYDGVSNNSKVAAALAGQPNAPAWQSLLPRGWNPSMGVTPPANAAQQKDLGYIKMVMAETAVMTGHANTTEQQMQAAYNYWIPKMLGIGNPPDGCDAYWVGRLLQPDTGGGGASGASFSSGNADTNNLMSGILAILDGPGSDEDKQRLIEMLLKKHHKAGQGGAAAAGGGGGGGGGGG